MRERPRKPSTDATLEAGHEMSRGRAQVREGRIEAGLGKKADSGRRREERLKLEKAGPNFQAESCSRDTFQARCPAPCFPRMPPRWSRKASGRCGQRGART